jgi:hypothetical protein
LWLNRVICLGVGELRPKEARVDYDMFALTSPSSSGTHASRVST